jgi:hypothetical protein
MSFPSLLFSERASGRTIDKGVFEDVKLSLLFSDEAINAMRVLCRPEDIPARQELFRALLEGSTKNLEHFKELAAAADNIRRLDEALNSTRCDNERNYLYLSLLTYTVSFYRLAARTPEGGGALLSRFTDWFKAEAESETFAAIERRCGELSEASETVEFYYAHGG